MSAISPASVVERLCRPQRLGLFGHRGVGKTTLLTMLYREAVAGRLPGLRLAAGDAICRNLATTARLPAPESFVAWLSDAGTDAIDRLTTDGPFRRPDGFSIAFSRAASSPLARS